MNSKNGCACHFNMMIFLCHEQVCTIFYFHHLFCVFFIDDFLFFFSFSFFIWSVQFSVKWFIDSFWVIHRPCQELFPLSSRVVVLWYPVCFLYNVVSRKVLQVNGCSVNIIIIIQSHGIRQEISNNSLTSKRNTITSSGAVTMESLNL